MEKEEDFVNSTLEENQKITDCIIEEYPRFFEPFQLDQDTTIGVLSNNRRVPESDKYILPPFDYIVASRHGLTLFNCSYSPIPLEWERLHKTAKFLIENSDGEILEDIIISRWRPLLRNRKMKGLLKLKQTINSVLITGIHLKDGLEDFYNLVLRKTSLDNY